MKRIYDTKEKVHNRALEAIGKTLGEIDENNLKMLITNLIQEMSLNKFGMTILLIIFLNQTLKKPELNLK